MDSSRPIDGAARLGDPLPAGAITCAEASAASGAFASGGASADLASELHTHFAGCEPCRERYRAAVEAAMATLRARRGDPRFASAPPRSLATRVRVPKRFVLALAFVALAGIVALPSRGRIRMRALGGEAHVGKVALTPGGEPADVVAGAFAATASGACAIIERGDARVVAGGSTTWSFEIADDLALRLLEGELELDGDVRVVTALGVIECADGGATVRLAGDVLDVDARAGRVTLTSAAACRELAPGEHLSVDLRSLAAPVSSPAR